MCVKCVGLPLFTGSIGKNRLWFSLLAAGGEGKLTVLHFPRLYITCPPPPVPIKQVRCVFFVDDCCYFCSGSSGVYGWDGGGSCSASHAAFSFWHLKVGLWREATAEGKPGVLVRFGSTSGVSAGRLDGVSCVDH